VDAEQIEEKTGYKVTAKAPAVTPGQPQLDEAGNPLITNRGAAGKEARFLGDANQRLSDAELKAMKPLLDRVVALDAITDDAAWLKAAQELQAALPALEKQILTGHPDLETAFEDIIGTALISGAVEAAQKRGPAIKNRKAAKLAHKAPKKGRGVSRPAHTPRRGR